MENIAYNVDCMEYMRTLPDKAFDLAVVDPPYGDALGDNGGGGVLGTDSAEYLTSTKSRVRRTGGKLFGKYGKKSSRGT